MVKNNGCLTCWPIITNQTKHRECLDDVIQDTTTKEDQQLKKQLQTSSRNAGEITKTKLPPIPQEEPYFLETIFPNRQPRTPTISSSPLQSPDWLTCKTRTCRERTNSEVYSGTRYACTGNDLQLMDVVPLTPDAYTHGMSSTLPAGFARKGGNHKEEEEWPEYMRRLECRRKQVCACSSCTDVNKSSEPYKYPTSQFSANFENKSYYNAHDMTDCTSSSYERCLGLPPSVRRTMSLARKESYDVPRKGSYDVPTNNYGSVIGNRFAFEEEMNDLMLSDSPPSRPEAGSYASPISYIRSQSTGATANNGRGRKAGGRGDIFYGEPWPTVSRERCPADSYDRPKWPAKAVTFPPMPSPAETRRSHRSSGKKPSKKCFVCGLKSKAIVERRCERNRSIETSSFDADDDTGCDEESSYVRPDPLGGIIEPESFLYRSVPITTLPVHSCGGIDCGGNYAYKSVRRQYDATMIPDNYLRPLSTKLCDSNESKKIQENETRMDQLTGAKGGNYVEEDKGECAEGDKTSLESQKLPVVQEVAIEFHGEPSRSYDVLTLLDGKSVELHETKLSLDELNERPSRSLNRLSQLDLLNMSPPPQCSYMADHSYMNAAISSKTNPTSSSESKKKEAENSQEQDLAQTNDDDKKQDELREMVISGWQKNVTSYQQQKQLVR